jgi:hypothetical protein
MLSRWSRLHLQWLAPTGPHWARLVGYGPFSLCVIHKEGLYLRIGDINRMMMMYFRRSKKFNWMHKGKTADVTGGKPIAARLQIVPRALVLVDYQNFL